MLRRPRLALLTLSLLCGCERPAPEREVVLARVGVPYRMAPTRPEQTAAPVRLGTQWRNAVAASAEGFELELPAGATRIAFSTGAQPRAAATARFQLEIRPSPTAAWQPLLERSAAGASWQDHEQALPAGGTRTLRLRGGAEGGEALWGSLLVLGREGSGAARPDIALLSLDTLGASYLGTFSGRRDVSPQLDAFLAANAHFARAFSQYGNTLVSHASLFSALQPRNHGVYGDLGSRVTRSLVTSLAEAGYRTVAITDGGFVGGSFGFATGFDAYDDGAERGPARSDRSAAQTFAQAESWLAAHPELSFLFLHSYEVHMPHRLRDAAATRVADRTTPGDARVFPDDEQIAMTLRSSSGVLPPPADLARLAALYLGEVRALDAAAGGFLAKLDAGGRAPPVLVAVTADHGEQFGEWSRMGHGHSLHNRVLHVPLALHWPGRLPPARIETPVALVDLMPTLLELAGVPLPAGLDGSSLVPLLSGAAGREERPVYSEQRTDPVDCAQQRTPLCQTDRVAVQTGRWKLVSSRFPAWTRLYDLAADPLEQRDVAAEHPDELARLAALVERYRAGAAPPPPTEATAPTTDPATLEQLRGLGYLE